jgi:hypothetical protein
MTDRSAQEINTTETAWSQVVRATPATTAILTNDTR